MLRSLRTLVATLLGGALATLAPAQDPALRLPDHGGPCGSCHTCDNPSPENLCLRGCNRAEAAAMAEAFKKRVPDLVILNELEELYLPVPFDHKGHADMAEMTRGCTVCHHFTPEGAEHPECKSCHEVSPVREDMRKPSLKAAYHRQCLACHREWSHETACEVCHPPKAGRGREFGMTGIPTKDDIMGRMHPPIPEPEIKTYQTKYKYVAGTNVTFRHKEHIHRFGFSCAECHHEDNCMRCHEDQAKAEEVKVKTLEEHHDPCAHCHDMESPERCDHCHWLEGEPEPPSFDHITTGWPLSPYHEDKSCRVCHEEVRFVKLDRECNACHSAWSPDTFDHAVTGQQLDEAHVEIDCEDCHVDRKFDRPPSCEECHDEEEGIVFPVKRPGPVASAQTLGSG